MTDLGWVPRSCTLPTTERPLRVAEWDTLFGERLTDVSRPEPLLLRLELSGGGVQERVRDLAERESGCCSFFTFSVAGEGSRVRLDIAVDQVHAPVLDALADRTGALAGAGEQA
ncbi:hypothetical protein [Streptomyces sp. HUAS TT20]|uniref:hypothetical protein n=1 Tax=Streptomyces sp. HUAS TT20 TaxID=3447509 RepID=UPI0021D80FEB|nr:hypothetical protein [Streptomyces sp. HUAS 15-9]UXY25519.1 hypothetical protein N8I87_02360 [Streptomyces sp. HUAS 15-9]